jgi:uncharacterized membrane protein YhaH (DUF805 family)
MGFADAIKACLGKYVTFSGRAMRSEFWWFVLFVFLVNLVAVALDAAIFPGSLTVEVGDGTAAASQRTGPIQAITSLALFLPQLSASWRRMHDTGRSGWFVLLPSLLGLCAVLVLVFGIGTASMFSGGTMDRLLTGATLLILVPTLLVLLISPLVVLWWLTRPSQPGPNVYGPNPHEVSQ